MLDFFFGFSSGIFHTMRKAFRFILHRIGSRAFLDGEEKNINKKNKYALFLYPDNLSTYWIIFFLAIVPSGVFLEIYAPYEKSFLASLAIAAVFFIVAYRLIYHCFRRPILDDLWKNWPQTLNQKKEFQNVPSKITFFSKTHCQKYQKLYPIVQPVRKKCCYKLLKEDLLKKTVSTFYFERPVYYSPGKSLQEVLLRAGIASLFAEGQRGERISIWNLISFSFYYFAHIWVSYLWLLLQLLCIFISGIRPEDSTMLHFVVPITLWAVITTCSLFVQFQFMNSSLVEYSRDLFLLAPPRLEEIIRKKMRINQKTMQYLPKLLSLVGGLTLGVYLVLVNLIMQAEVPSEKVFKCKETTSNYSLSIEIKK